MKITCENGRYEIQNDWEPYKPEGWRPDYNSMDLEDDSILFYLAERKRTPQTPEEEKLFQEICALQSRGYSITNYCE